MRSLRRSIIDVAELPFGVSPWILRQLRTRRLGFRREHYLFCVERAALEAVALGRAEMSVIEFGVAGGNGLCELERICDHVEKRLPIRLQVFGFDRASGLPAPADYRDLPFKWQPGDYEMDEDALRRRLRRSQLILGEVDETVTSFYEVACPPPLGAVMFDLDYYSSTVSALRIFDGPAGNRLPRVHCYFDDLGTIPSVGVPLAISEFNSSRTMSKLEQNQRTVHATNPFVRGWKIYEYHDFTHPDYTRPLRSGLQAPLRLN